ncbi:HAD family hydrolase [Crenobacter caeni]|uniref:Histidinol-phosphatase n=1 Tax=Crenobacter caeni TaxID=2705474 RepID=A0A6B2KW46_9NEIS|nr:HAD family hydrolase [Crenobacter caeni]NDV14243.1 HAD family hydrolase [Crenobacter caeni]
MNLALFDLDNTLLAGDSDVEWPKFLIGRGILDAEHHARHNDYFYEQYKAGTLDIDAFLEFQLAPLARFTREELDRLHAAYMGEHILPIIPAKARALVAAHQAQGDLVMIVTATNRFITGPIARELGVEHLIAVELEEDADGRYTGRYTGTPSFKDGKITRLNEWLAARGQTLASFGHSFFYSDSRNDLPLLSLVSDPVAVDPDDALREHAISHGWPVITLRD